ncbi:hypothetical protein E2C01_101080 [Portunus trituberculatus]|uniref:Uncharacterized protein n=1 Tax=Portunus trituberculatus TaxID=210409 RepID=A0A5B7K8M3_PORTR|nr:hypothetical protein [Portunus trituberculatus]
MLLNTLGAADTKACLRRNPGTPVESRSRSRSILLWTTCAPLTPLFKTITASTTALSSLAQLTTKTPCNVA